jgi:hypothetical protein
MEVVVYANYIGLRRFYQYVVNIGKWSPYEGGQRDRFHCTAFFQLLAFNCSTFPCVCNGCTIRLICSQSPITCYVTCGQTCEIPGR